MVIQNYFYLVAGVAAFFFAIGHSAWGMRFILNKLRISNAPEYTKHMLFVIWHQPTVFHFLSGVALVTLSTLSNKAITIPLALFIGLVSLGFLLNFLGTSLVRNRAALAPILPQAVVVFIYLGIIMTGIFQSVN